MDNLIPIIDFHDREGIQAVSARALYAYLYPDGDPDNFSRWTKRFIQENEYAIRGEDWVTFTSEGNPQGGRPAAEFHLHLTFAKKLAMMATRSDRAENIRNYFIAVEARARLTELQNTWNLPRSYSAALIALAEKCDAYDKVEAQIVAQAPLVAFAERVQSSPTTCTVDTAAKELGLPVLPFRKFVQDKYLFRRGRDLLPYEQGIKNGWFDIKTSIYNHSGVNITYHTAMVTGTGRIRLKQAWDKSRALETVQ